MSITNGFSIDGALVLVLLHSGRISQDAGVTNLRITYASKGLFLGIDLGSSVEVLDGCDTKSQPQKYTDSATQTKELNLSSVKIVKAFSTRILRALDTVPAVIFNLGANSPCSSMSVRRVPNMTQGSFESIPYDPAATNICKMKVKTGCNPSVKYILPSSPATPDVGYPAHFPSPPPWRVQEDQLRPGSWRPLPLKKLQAGFWDLPTGS
ncbi:hypothetical protein BDK51DRAFT_34919 [Blyttiomyces helicus]|uniref:Uncharacterized protein n=1 Tax=Blyttiomyces helicus TaxID=388810 RepID=A0A4P9WDL6_9FUNG|nr:hypothetical protein BDK51DRAFT_34919 [Blyttiomyces helicus]|eukprot:RKO89050.1 hypothetical protein BDK51DRAFT_34919 [Blyttiomyces helicus]